MTIPHPPPRDAYYEGLPIYRLAVDVAVRIDAAVRGFSRYHKYGVGSELRRLSTEAAVLVARANQRQHRAAAQEALCDCADRLKVQLNLAKEYKAFASFAAYAATAAPVVDLARQAYAWRRHSMGLSGPERTEPDRRARS